jgi:FAD/FMN-containing dehydrogenase
MFALGAVMEPGDVERVELDAGRVVDALAPYASGSDYLNFVESGSYDVSKAFSPESWERLKRVKAQVDPDGLFLANHEIPA